jgi:hypothetical protein
MIFFTIRKYSQSTKSILYRIGVILFVIELKWIQNENSSENTTNEKNILDIHPLLQET